MKHYTSTIPPTLAEKLKEKGMPMEEGGESMTDWKVPTFGACFDWLMEQKKTIVIDYTKYDWVAIIVDNDSLAQFKEVGDFFTWHEAADAAIEKALTLI